MTEYFIPKTQEVRLPGGAVHVVVKGIREVPDDLASSQEANRIGIKPPHEMTDAECDDLGVPRVPKTEVPVMRVAQQAVAPAASAKPDA